MRIIEKISDYHFSKRLELLIQGPRQNQTRPKKGEMSQEEYQRQDFDWKGRVTGVRCGSNDNDTHASDYCNCRVRCLEVTNMFQHGSKRITRIWVPSIRQRRFGNNPSCGTSSIYGDV
jgi:hypothetical protein